MTTDTLDRITEATRAKVRAECRLDDAHLRIAALERTLRSIREEAISDDVTDSDFRDAVFVVTGRALAGVL